MINKKWILLGGVIALGFVLKSYTHSYDIHRQQSLHYDATPIPIVKKDDLTENEDSSFQKNQNTVASNGKLEGSVTNKFGIRDDILQFIEREIPEKNSSALIAAIKLAHYDNKIYYHTTNQEEAIKLSKKEALALSCLENALPNEWQTLAEGVRKLMRNNPARDKHIWNTDEKYFSWKVLGTGLTDNEEKERCDSGNF